VSASYPGTKLGVAGPNNMKTVVPENSLVMIRFAFVDDLSLQCMKRVNRTK